MVAKDIYHDSCVRALEKDGWTVTDDPLVIPYGSRDLQIDLGAERLVAAERQGERIAVEIKSFIKPSPIQDLKEAVGQFILYEDAIEESPKDSDRTLYLAIREQSYNNVFRDEINQKLIEKGRLRLVLFDPQTEVIVRWIP